MNKLISLFALILLSSWSIEAQNYFDIRLVTHSINCETNEVCYDVQIRSSQDRLWRFAGQNYRMFYNGALAEFSRVEQVKDDPYAPPKVVQDIQHLDLSADGNLNFDSDISWLNYFIDMNTVLQGDILSPDIWTTTSRVCFNTLVDVMDDPALCFEMVWARNDLTFNYATAFVEVSEWIDVNSTSDLVFGDTYHDLNSESGDEACFNVACGNDMPPSYNAKITLQSADTVSNISCYAIELQSATNRVWPLHDQTYSLFFDGSQSTFVSASSSIDGFSDAVINNLSENQEITDGSGALSFESSLSEINFTISKDDTDPALITAQEYIQVAEFCLDFSNSQAGPNDCFEVVFGREGFTDDYGTDFTTVSSKQGDQSIDADGVNYLDYEKCPTTICKELEAPISTGDVTVCEGLDLETISVEEVSGQTARWYETAEGGTPIGQGITFIPPTEGIFYAEALRQVDGCISEERTPIAIIISPAPSIEIISKTCEEDQNTYNVQINTNASSVESSTGTVEKQLGNEWHINNIADGEDVILILTNDITGCIRNQTIQAPDCQCPLISEPLSGGDQVICFGDDIPLVTATVIQENTTIDWYSKVDGGSPLVEGQLEYTPQNIVETGVYSYYAQARSLESGCESAMRTEVKVTVLEPPIYAMVHAECTPDLQSYGVKIYSDAILIESNFGGIQNVGNGVWFIDNIPSDEDLSLSIVGSAGCTLTREIAAPSCECPDIEAPICNGFVSACDESDHEEFVAFVPRNQVIHWYDSPIGGNLLATGDRFKPNLPGIYYVEARDTITGCVSQERAEAELVINAVPDLEIITDVFCKNETIIWSEIVSDQNSTDGVLDVFASFADALNNVNAIESDTYLVNTFGAYFFRKTTGAGCFDIETVIIYPEDCQDDCMADAGRYTADGEVCYDGFMAMLSTNEVETPTLPTGYVQAFIITEGDSLKVFDFSDIPQYVVDAPGIYTIHSFVFLPFDTLLDQLIGDDGINTLYDLYILTIEGGGIVCADVDIEGARFEVNPCTDACAAFTSNPTALEVPCYDDEQVELAIEFNPIDAIIPEGYQQLFVLTQGPELIIMGAQVENFLVDGPGEYRVHSLIYDETTLDLSSIDPGFTTGFDVFDLTIEGGGDICASLDLEGALFEIEQCAVECEAHSGLTSIPDDINCLEDGSITLTPSVSDDIVIPDGFSHTYLLSRGADDVFLDAQIVSFSVDAPGEYIAYSFVYDPLTFDLSSIVFGETEFFDVYFETIEGGGNICASLEFFGVSVLIEECVKVDLELSKSISDQNPTEGQAVTFTITVFNNSEFEATGVSVVDYLPNGYGFTGNVSDDGIGEGLTGTNTKVLWSNLSIAAGGTEMLTFTASVNTIGDDVDYKNVAEIIGTDQPDVDSTPNNDDGDQSEDDEDAVSPQVQEAFLDFELIKTADITSIYPGNSVTFNINVINRAMVEGTNVEVVDELPAGFDISSVSNINEGGGVDGNTIRWSNLAFGFLSNKNLKFTVRATADASGIYKNTAQVTASDQPDIDSTPNNDDGDQSEDDEDSAEIEVLVPFIDLSLEKTVDNTNPLPGDFVQFDISLKNDGVITATGVSVSDLIPMTGYNIGSIRGVNPAAQLIGNTLVWSELSIDPGEELVFGFEIAVLPDGEYKNIAQVTSANEQDIDSTPNNDDGDQSEDDEDAATVSPGMVPDEICDNGIDDDGDGLVDIDDLDCPAIIDLELDKTVSDIQPTIGDVVNYSITIVNNGPSDATNIQLRDVTPDGIDAREITGSHTYENGVITWTVPSLPPGESMTFMYESIVFESDNDDYTNIVQVISADQQDADSTPGNDDGDQSEDDEDAITLFPQVPVNVDIEISKRVGTDCIEAQDRITYYIDISNTSDMIATGVGITDILPDGLYNTDDVSSGGIVNGTQVEWTGLSLLAGETFTVSYTARVKDDADSYTNTAQLVALDQVDIDSSPNNDNGDQSEDDEASLTITVGAELDLELQKIVDNPFAPPGARVRFDLIISNKGCVNATGVSVKDVIPGGYRAIYEITDFGQRDGNVIIWEDLSIDAKSSKTVSFTAEVVHFSINCDYINVAEIMSADQVDIDSAPNNDDGDQSEDDEDSAEVFAGFMADLEVEMTADKEAVTTGDQISFTIKVCNNGPSNAFNVAIRDYLPEGLEVVGDLNYKGTLNGNEITWSNFTFVSGDCVELIVNAIVLPSDANRILSNAVEVVVSDQVDPDSSPGNGDEAEDDYDKVEIQHLVPVAQVLDVFPIFSKVNVETALFLEGAFNAVRGEMNTTLNRLGYLPGQAPSSFFSQPTPSGQPYSVIPWLYYGSEGSIYDADSEQGLDYPEDVVDWVLVSLRTGLDQESTIFTQAALLFKDGTVVPPSDAKVPTLDVNEAYYLVIEHRNHLPIMSPKKVEVLNGVISFDFRYNESYTALLGSGQKDVNGIYCVYAANGDQFTEALSRFDINVRDLDDWYKKNGLNSAYMNADYDLNGDVNVQDQIIWLLNNGIFSDVPR